MVNYSTIASAAILALSASVAAAPTASKSPAASFSFSQWIEDIIANPEGNHLSPEEAVAARDAAAEAYDHANPLTKRVYCDQSWYRANAAEAAACLDDLARKGAAGIDCVIGNQQTDIQMCRIGDAQVVGSKRDRNRQSANCNDIARTGGLIFDSCWRADNTIKGSEFCITNPAIQVNINRVE